MKVWVRLVAVFKDTFERVIEPLPQISDNALAPPAVFPQQVFVGFNVVAEGWI